jgi:hypothetical protein
MQAINSLRPIGGGNPNIVKNILLSYPRPRMRRHAALL